MLALFRWSRIATRSKEISMERKPRMCAVVDLYEDKSASRSKVYILFRDRSQAEESRKTLELMNKVKLRVVDV